MKNIIFSTVPILLATALAAGPGLAQAQTPPPVDRQQQEQQEHLQQQQPPSPLNPQPQPIPEMHSPELDERRHQAQRDLERAEQRCHEQSAELRQSCLERARRDHDEAMRRLEDRDPPTQRR